MGSSSMHKAVTIRAPLDFVFDRITDHEAMGEWPGISSCHLVREGTPRNGVGAVRRIKLLGMTLDEEVLVFEPPSSYEYTIIKGLPVEHHGTVTLTPSGGAVRLTWDIEISSGVPLLAQVLTRALDIGLTRALRDFVQKTERFG